MSQIVELRSGRAAPPSSPPVRETHAPAGTAPAGCSRPAGTSWKFGEDFADFGARQLGGRHASTENRQPGHRIANDLRFPATSLLRSQHNGLTFDLGFQRIPRLQSKPATDFAGDHDLPLRRDSRKHGKTILPCLEAP